MNSIWFVAQPRAGNGETPTSSNGQCQECIKGPLLIVNYDLSAAGGNRGLKDNPEEFNSPPKVLISPSVE